MQHCVMLLITPCQHSPRGVLGRCVLVGLFGSGWFGLVSLLGLLGSSWVWFGFSAWFVWVWLGLVGLFGCCLGVVGVGWFVWVLLGYGWFVWVWLAPRLGEKIGIARASNRQKRPYHLNPLTFSWWGLAVPSSSKECPPFSCDTDKLASERQCCETLWDMLCPLQHPSLFQREALSLD